MKWLVRFAAICFVAFGVKLEELFAESPPDPLQIKQINPPATAPQWLTREIVASWRIRSSRNDPMRRLETAMIAGSKDEARSVVNAAPKTLEALITEELAARGAPKADAERLDRALDECAREGLIDHWIAGYIWRRSAQQPTAALYEHLATYVRLSETLIRAQAQLKAVEFTPWMSKAAPPREHHQKENALRGELFTTAVSLFPSATLGTWNEAGVSWTVKSGELVLSRAGSKTPVSAGAKLDFGRLDLLELGKKPVLVEHAWLGAIQLPAGRVISVWDLPGLLDVRQKKLVHEVLARALDGSEKDALLLEGALPHVQAIVREAVERNEKRPGAPRLRMILAAFDG